MLSAAESTCTSPSPRPGYWPLTPAGKWPQRWTFKANLMLSVSPSQNKHCAAEGVCVCVCVSTGLDVKTDRNNSTRKQSCWKSGNVERGVHRRVACWKKCTVETPCALSKHKHTRAGNSSTQRSTIGDENSQNKMLFVLAHQTSQQWISPFFFKKAFRVATGLWRTFWFCKNLTAVAICGGERNTRLFNSHFFAKCIHTLHSEAINGNVCLTCHKISHALSYKTRVH